LKEAIAKKLIELRGGKSREEVANAVGISVSALRMYENANRVPRDDIKIRIARYYGVSVEELFFGKEVHDSCTGAQVS
jgi:putative transcriptional regulator